MKKLLLFGLTLIAGTALYAQTYYEYNTNLPSGFVVQDVADLQLDATGANQMALLNVNTPSGSGFMTYNYDLNAGTTVTSNYYSGCVAVRSASDATYQYVLINKNVSGYLRMSVLKINKSTGVVAATYQVNQSGYHIKAVDLSYDVTNGYLYVLGNSTSSGLSHLVVWKITAATMTLSWQRNLLTTPGEEFGNNIQYYSNSEIYIGGRASYGFRNDRGLMIQLNSTGALVYSQVVDWGNYFVTGAFVKRNGNYVYLTMQDLASAEAFAQDLVVAKFNTNFTLNTYSVYTYLNGMDELKQFDFSGTALVVPVSQNIFAAVVTPGFANLVFDANTAYIGSPLYPFTSDGGFTASQHGTNAFGTFVYSVHGKTGNTYFSRIKGGATASTGCEVVTPLGTVNPPATIAPYSIGVGTKSVAVVTISQHAVPAPCTDSTICTYNPGGGRIGHNEAAGAVSGETVLTLYPNPAANMLNVQFDHAETMHVEILDAAGRTVFRDDYNTAAAAISLDGLAPGMYVLRATAETGEYALQRFVKE